MYRLVVLALLYATPLLAETLDEKQVNAAIFVVQSQRNACYDQFAQMQINAQAQIAKLTKEIADLKKSGEPEKKP